MKAKRGMYESPQAAPDGLSTGELGGKAPGAREVIKSANARASKRHAVKSPSDNEADSLFGRSGGSTVEKDGIDNTSYITKKGLVYGANAFYNTLPPGMDIEDQENADIRKEPQKDYHGGTSYPGDGGF